MESLENLENLFKFKLRNSTIREFEQYKKSEEALVAIIQAHGWNSPNVAKEKESLLQLWSKKRTNGWIRACEKAWGFNLDNGTYNHKLGSLDHLEAAEKCALEAGSAPPHWTKTHECPRCGIVVISPKLELSPTDPCPWCPYLSAC